MSRRKIPSKRRIKARFHAGKPLTSREVAPHDLAGWLMGHRMTYDSATFSIRKAAPVPFKQVGKSFSWAGE